MRFFHGTTGQAAGAICEVGLIPIESAVYVCPVKRDARFYAAWKSVLQPLKFREPIAWPVLAAVVELDLDSDAPLAPDPEDPQRQWRHEGAISPSRVVGVTRRALPSAKAAERFGRDHRGKRRQPVVCSCRRPARLEQPSEFFDLCRICRLPMEGRS